MYRLIRLLLSYLKSTFAVQDTITIEISTLYVRAVVSAAGVSSSNLVSCNKNHIRHTHNEKQHNAVRFEMNIMQMLLI